MKTITLSQFKELIARDDWQRTQDYDSHTHTDKIQDPFKEDELIDIEYEWGWASVTSSLEDITITYSENFQYQKYNADSFETWTEGLDNVWSIAGVTVIDEDGDEVTVDFLSYHLDDDFKYIDYSTLLACIDEVIEIDVSEDEDIDMKTFTLEIDNKPDLRFAGELVARATSINRDAVRSYSETGRWTDLELYKTKGGKFICYQVGRTNWSGERDRHSGKVCETVEEVKEFFGYGWLAKELYDEAGIDVAVDVE
jgi:hypothetical protein